MEKKNPFVTTVGFKKDDPDHVYVAELLNSMGRGKAQYIVKAVMLYQDMQESGSIISAGGAYNYERIKRVVLQVLEEKERTTLQQKGIENEANISKDKLQKDEWEYMGLDDSVLNGIIASLSAFQQQ